MRGNLSYGLGQRTHLCRRQGEGLNHSLSCNKVVGRPFSTAPGR